MGRELSRVAKAGGGFADYRLARPGATAPTPKVSYLYDIPEWGWAIGAGIWVDDVNAALWGLARRLVLALLPLACAALALAVFLTRDINTQLSGLATRMRAIARGDLDTEIVGAERGDELGDMARALETFKATAIEKIRVTEARERERQAHAEAERAAEAARAADAQAQEAARALAETRAIEHERAGVVSSIGAGLARLAARDLTTRIVDRLPDAYARLQADFNITASALH